MPAPMPKPTIDSSGRFIDTESGLVVPRSYARRALDPTVITRIDSAITPDGFNGGVKLDRDHDTLAVRWQRKGGGLDDLINQAIVDGNVANVGVSPVIAPQISAMVRRQQSQAVTASVELSGRKTPVRSAKDAISRFNDSPLGVTEALERMIYQLCTYNRGAPVATVPLIYDMSEWEANGMYARPILSAREKEKNATRFYLEVDWGKHGTPVPYLPSPFDLEPSGIPNYPYWYRARRDNKSVWVLLHHTHILEVLPGRSAAPGVGTSSVWMCLGYLAESILFTDERVEKMLYALTDGLILLGGVQGADGEWVKQSVEKARAEAMTQGYAVSKGSTIITSPLDKVSAVQINFRQPPGVEFKEWREYAEDIIAFCFGEPLSTMVVRGGVGYGAQAAEASTNTQDSGIAAMLYRIGVTFGAIYPRVQVAIIRPSDRSQRANIAMLQTFAGAVSALPPETLSRDEVRAIIDRDIIDIPQVDSMVTSANASEDEEDQGPNADSGGESVGDSSGSDNSGTTTDNAMSALAALETLYERDGVDITDEDVDQAIDAAADIDPILYELLTADAVEE